MASLNETVDGAIFDQTFIDEYAAQLESNYGDVAADLWNEETLKGYEALLYEIIGPNAKSYVKENLRTYKPLPVFRFEDTLPATVDVYDLTHFINGQDLSALFDEGFDTAYPDEFLEDVLDSDREGGEPVVESIAAGICQIDAHSCIMCGHNESASVRIAIGTNNSEGLLKICASWNSGQTWFLTGYASLVDDYSVPYSCFQFNGGPASELIYFVQNAIGLPNPYDYCDFDDYSSQFTGQNAAIGNGGYDEIHGSQYSDQLTGEFVAGYDGDDTLSIQYTTSGVDARVALGMYGDDQIYGSNYADYLWGGYGDDTIYGWGGNDFLYGHEHLYIVQYYYGEGLQMYYEIGEFKGGDSIVGGTGKDKICGGGGSSPPWVEKIDHLYGGSEADLIWGDFCECTDPHGGGVGAGCDYGSMDIVYAGSGDDKVYGGKYNDEIHGGTGDDILYGGPWWDWIYGDDGDDRCWGGMPYIGPPPASLDDEVYCEMSCADCGDFTDCGLC
jgi:Ca2+-binding RTX toxin-like protein